MKQNKWMSLLGLANRAGKTCSGEELVIREIQRNRAKLVLLASDASHNTKKRITNKCEYYNVPLKVVSDRHALGKSIGKEARVAVAITDQGFSRKMIEALDQN